VERQNGYVRAGYTFFVHAILMVLLAATEIHFVNVNTGTPGGRPEVHGKLLVDGAHRRTDFDDGASELSEVGSTSLVTLDHRTKSWWRAPDRVGTPRTLSNEDIHTKSSKVRDLRVTASDEPADEVFAGMPSHKYVVRATYKLDNDVYGSPAMSDHGYTLFVWTTDKVDSALAYIPATRWPTGIAAVDAQLAPKLAAVPGFPLKTVLIASRAFAGGMPQTLMNTTTITEIRTVDAPADAFAVPAGYKQTDPPVIVGPAPLKIPE